MVVHVGIQLVGGIQHGDVHCGQRGRRATVRGLHGPPAASPAAAAARPSAAHGALQQVLGTSCCTASHAACALAAPGQPCAAPGAAAPQTLASKPHPAAPASSFQGTASAANVTSSEEPPRSSAPSVPPPPPLLAPLPACSVPARGAGAAQGPAGAVGTLAPARQARALAPEPATSERSGSLRPARSGRPTRQVVERDPAKHPLVRAADDAGPARLEAERGGGQHGAAAVQQRRALALAAGGERRGGSGAEA